MKITMFIRATWNKYAGDSGAFQYDVCNSDMTEYGYVMVDERELEFESPVEQDLKMRVIQSLKAKKEKKRAEAQAELNEIDEEIQELLAIEDKS